MTDDRRPAVSLLIYAAIVAVLAIVSLGVGELLEPRTPVDQFDVSCSRAARDVGRC